VPYVVTEPCIGCRYGECVAACPQQAFREGPNFVVIDPAACSNCALCELVCPVGAIRPAHALGADQREYVALNARLAAAWPPATQTRPLPDADRWAQVSGKRARLDPGVASR
jgi:ferredoxin